MCPETDSGVMNGDTETTKDTPIGQMGSNDANAGCQDADDGQKDAGRVETQSTDLENAMTRERKRQARKRKREAQRLKRRQNTSVYISDVPSDATEQELAEHFAKCGIILPSADTGRPRVKLYKDEDGNVKGDALVTYAMQPSVENAVAILDDAPLRPGGQPLKVQPATFDHKRESETVDSAGEAKRRRGEGEEEKRSKTGFRARDLVQEALSWAEEGQDVAKTPRIVILKNVFDSKEADYGVIREDMAEGCDGCGSVEKVTVFERNAEGAVAVKFTTLEACVECIKVMDGRWYDGRKLSAEFYDGVSDYRYKETEEERCKREKKWQEWLDDGEKAPEKDTGPVGSEQ